jgi:hypothetical protein
MGIEVVNGSWLKRNAHPTSAQALHLLVETLARHSSLSMSDERAIRRLHPRVRKVTNPRQFGAFCTIPGNLCLYGTAWWG